jgi:sugar (pentulose or hexulose) kinase
VHRGASGIVVNLGLKSVRAIAFSSSGSKIASSAMPIRTFLRDSWIEQDADEWWARSVECAREVVEYTGPDVRFLTVTASSSCIVPVDASGRALRRAIMVSDRRASEQAERLRDVAAFREIWAANPALTPDPYHMLPKAMWLIENEPEVCRATRWMLSPADYLVLRLTGEAVTDPLNAEKFCFDTSAKVYPTAAMEQLGFSPSMLPTVLPIGSEVGGIMARAAEDLGLKAGTPVRLATYDAICAFLGSGVQEAGDVADVSGTVTSVRLLSRNGAPVIDRRIFAQRVPELGFNILGGSNNLGGGLIEWLKQSFYPADELAYDLIEQEARTSGVGARGLLFLPYLLGERCPVWDADARGVFFGLERQHQRGDFARSVCESAAFSVEHILQAIRACGAIPTRVRASGGLARLRLVNDIKADVTGLPVEVLDEFETTAVGAFILAGLGDGLFSSLSEAASIVNVREVVLPNPERRQRYSEWFELYLKLYDTLRDLFVERRRLFDRHELGGVGRLENL